MHNYPVVLTMALTLMLRKLWNINIYNKHIWINNNKNKSQNTETLLFQGTT